MHRNLSYFSLALATAVVFFLAGCGAGGGSSGSKSG